MKYSYPYEIFSLAVDSMAGSPESLQQRIANAYIYHLIKLKVEDLPEELMYRFEALDKRLTNRGNIQESIKDMGKDEAIDLAREILFMADVIKSRHRES